MKKILLTFGVATAIASPVIAVVSCGKTQTKESNEKQKVSEETKVIIDSKEETKNLVPPLLPIPQPREVVVPPKLPEQKIPKLDMNKEIERATRELERLKAEDAKAQLDKVNAKIAWWTSLRNRKFAEKEVSRAEWLERLKDKTRVAKEAKASAAAENERQSHILANYNDMTLPDDFRISPEITTIASKAFSGSTLPVGFTVPNTVTSIGDMAFTNAILPKGFALPDSLTSIGYMMFYGASLPDEFILPTSITSIGGYAFSDITLPAGFFLPWKVETIENLAFAKAKLPAGFTIPSSVTTIGDLAFSIATLPVGFTIPKTVASIGQFAFVGVQLPENCSWYYLDTNIKVEPENIGKAGTYVGRN